MQILCKKMPAWINRSAAAVLALCVGVGASDRASAMIYCTKQKATIERVVLEGFSNQEKEHWFGISIKLEDGSTQNYYQKGYSNLSYPEARVLVEVAMMAYATKAPVRIWIEGTSCVQDKLNGDELWYRSLRGIDILPRGE